jgi:hypothetical protein
MLRKLLLLMSGLALATVGYSLLRGAREALSESGPRPAAAATEPGCRARTKSGSRCSRPAEPGSLYCWQHQGSDEAAGS